MGRPAYQRTADTTSLLERAVINGHAYRVSGRETLNQDEEFIVHIDPVPAGGTVYIEAPRVVPSVVGDYDVYENADPQTNLVDDLEVHNMRYDTGEGAESPEALVQRVSTGGLDTSGADKTEESRVTVDSPEVSTGTPNNRSIYRIIPNTDVISLVYTDRSTGNGNDVSLDLVLYEGETLPQ